jgi:hypothetical protein
VGYHAEDGEDIDSVCRYNDMKMGRLRAGLSFVPVLVRVHGVLQWFLSNTTWEGASIRSGPRDEEYPYHSSGECSF